MWNRENGWITTANGEPFHPDRPTFNVEVIAHSLSQQCRFNGHTRTFYSVAEHSLMVAELMELMQTGDPFEGLMHDGCEAYIGDVPAPFKQKNPTLKVFEDDIDNKLRPVFGLPAKKTLECKRADIMAMFIEAYWLMPHQGRECYDEFGLRDRALDFRHDLRPVCFPPLGAKEPFLAAYRKLALIHPNVPSITN